MKLDKMVTIYTANLDSIIIKVNDQAWQMHVYPLKCPYSLSHFSIFIPLRFILLQNM